MKNVVLLTGAGQIGMAIARRIGHGKKIIISDKNIDNAENISKIMREAGFDTEAFECDISSRDSIKNIIKKHRNMVKFHISSMPQEYLLHRPQ